MVPPQPAPSWIALPARAAVWTGRWRRQLAIVALLAVGLGARTLAQELPRPELDLEAFAQDMFAVQDEDLNYADLYESLLQLYTNPLDLNAATRDELLALLVLSPAQVNALLDHRARFGPLLSLYELQAVAGFDRPLIYRLLPFVKLSPAGADNRPLWQRIRAEPNHYLVLRYDQTLERARGFSPPDTVRGAPTQRYAGGPGQWYARYRVSHAKDFSFGFTAESDAGERLAWDPARRTYGADFWSVHAQLQNRGRWKNVAVGDYQLQFGQGLVLAAGFTPGKGAETITTVRRSNLGIRPYTSVVEQGFFRGAAATYQLNSRLDLTAFYSGMRRDANLINQADTLQLTEDFVTSILATGLHRTPGELDRKATIREQNVGGNLTYRSRDQTLQLGFTALHTQFDRRLQRRDLLYNRFEFNGAQNTVLGLNYAYAWRNVNLFGEWARSGSGGVGGLAGLVASLSPKVDLSLLYRHYDRDFHSFYANTFGENVRNSNERGMYAGLRIAPSRRLWVNAYFDQFRFPWLRFQVDAPSRGTEWLARLTWQPSKTLVLYAQVREETKGRNLVGNAAPLDVVVDTRRRNYALQLDYQPTRWLALKTRVQGSDFGQVGGAPATGGFSLVQDLDLTLGRFKCSTRLALFDTDDYENRQYVYEKDVWYAFSIPAYYDRGTRTYFLLQYRINRRLDVWLRYARTALRNQPTIGAGLDQINAPHRTDLRLQLRYNLGG